MPVALAPGGITSVITADCPGSHHAAEALTAMKNAPPAINLRFTLLNWNRLIMEDSFGYRVNGSLMAIVQSGIAIKTLFLPFDGSVSCTQPVFRNHRCRGMG
jgi:hypothetical protein